MLAHVIALGLMSAVGASVPAGAAGCDAGLDWGGGNVVQLRYQEPAVDMRLRRYANAVLFSFTGADGISKSYIEVQGGPSLVRNASAQEFIDAAMPFELPLFYLRSRYATPCAIPASDRFRYRLDVDPMKMSRGPVQVTGSVQRHGAAIDYALAIEPVDAGLPSIHIDGRWEHVADVPIPEDMDVRGWKPVVENWRADENAAPATIAEARAYRRVWKPATPAP